MGIEFDPAKDEANVAKHGVSLARAVDLEIEVVVLDERFSAETRYRAWGMLDGLPHALAITVRGARVRARSLRRCHLKEYRRHVR